MGGGPDITYPQQPTYGEGMADALRAQVDLLRGTGDFSDTGGLESLLPLEESIRRKTAQTDTDVLRQTLLGNQQQAATGTYDSEGRLVIGEKEPRETSPKLKLITVQEPTEFVPGRGGARPVESQPAKDGIYRIEDQDGNVYASDTSMSDPQSTLNALQNQVGNNFTPGEPIPIYAIGADGNIIVDKSKAGETGSIPASRLGDGMIDLLGDRRNVQEFTTRDATQADVEAGLASEVGESITEASGNRQAGFDADGEFLGLSALAEDIQRGNLSRQREADLADVERLSDRYRGVMEDYKPAATSGLDDARILLEQQRENLTGLRKATQADVDAGNATEVGELFQTGQGQGSGPISMPSTLDSADYAMSGDAAIGQLDSGEDTLRSALLADARGALNEGLTDREMKQVEESARARQTLMGRTFDQKGAIEEAEARIMEDNQRKMQNRAFAQSALGQEAGIQTGDAARAMTTDQFNVGAKMDAERLNESLRQQGLSNYINAVGNLAQMEDKFMLDPFQALLGRGGGNALQQGQSVFGQAGYGLSSEPQYLNPEAGLGFISQNAANQANIAAAQAAAQGSAMGGLFGGLGALGGGLFGGLASAGKIF